MENNNTFTRITNFDERMFTVEHDKYGMTTTKGKTFRATDVVGYYISHDGYVLSTKRKGFPIILNECDNGHGYSQVKLMNNGKQSSNYVHRLVAKQWIPNPLNKEQVNHLDGDTKNNNVSNLEWTTHEENQKHKHWMNLMRKACGSNYMKFNQELEKVA